MIQHKRWFRTQHQTSWHKMSVPLRAMLQCYKPSTKKYVRNSCTLWLYSNQSCMWLSRLISLLKHLVNHPSPGSCSWETLEGHTGFWGEDRPPGDEAILLASSGWHLDSKQSSKTLCIVHVCWCAHWISLVFFHAFSLPDQVGTSRVHKGMGHLILFLLCLPLFVASILLFLFLLVPLLLLLLLLLLLTTATSTLYHYYYY